MNVCQITRTLSNSSFAARSVFIAAATLLQRCITGDKNRNVPIRFQWQRAQQRAPVILL